tara:strand:- start:5 stop:391 length:387 start_codon:yes stop_codon:yes gene_type:complete
MENKNNPLSPHLQIYSWSISSLLSITHRIVGVINIIAIIFICFWTILLSLDESNYEFIEIFSQSFFGKFFIIFLSWSFSFHILNEIRHLAWDMGYGFDLKVSQITGIITIFGSFILAILIYLFGRNII